MSLKELLNREVQEVPDCRSACYVDMPAGLVLGSASTVPQPQEVFDALARRAALLLHAGGFAQTLTSRDVPPFFLYSAAQVEVFARSRHDPEQALCYICASVADAGAVAARIAEGDRRIAETFGFVGAGQ